MKLSNNLKRLFQMDKVFQQEKEDEVNITISVTSLVVALTYAVFIIVNAISGPRLIMLDICGCIISIASISFAIFFNKPKISAYMNMTSCAIIFTSYIILGGNQGFEIMWIILFPLVAMLAYDLKLGFLYSVYFLFFLILFFYTGLGTLIENSIGQELSDYYSSSFVVRFPVYYLTVFTFSSFITVVYKWARYDSLIKEKNLTETKTQLAEKVEELELERKNLQFEKDLDRLSNLSNRSKYEYDKNVLYKNMSSCGVVFCDVNNLKKINDTYGHDEGDKAIQKASLAILDACNDNVLAYRYGGDEFVIIAKNLDFNDMAMIVKQITSKLDILNIAEDIKVELAIGYSFAKDKIDLDILVNDADEKMYRNKKAMKEEASMYE